MTKPTTARTCIVEAFLQLCQTLPCDKITVSQLTKKAGYNRSTFYAYFNNTDDLLKQLENELFQLVDTFLPHGLRIFRTGMPTAEERLLSQRFFKSNARILAMLICRYWSIATSMTVRFHRSISGSNYAALSTSQPCWLQ